MSLFPFVVNKNIDITWFQSSQHTCATEVIVTELSLNCLLPYVEWIIYLTIYTFKHNGNCLQVTKFSGHLGYLLKLYEIILYNWNSQCMDHFHMHKLCTRRWPYILCMCVWWGREGEREKVNEEYREKGGWMELKWNVIEILFVSA